MLFIRYAGISIASSHSARWNRTVGLSFKCICVCYRLPTTDNWKSCAGLNLNIISREFSEIRVSNIGGWACIGFTVTMKSGYQKLNGRLWFRLFHRWMFDVRSIHVNQTSYVRFHSFFTGIHNSPSTRVILSYEVYLRTVRLCMFVCVTLRSQENVCERKSHCGCEWLRTKTHILTTYAS